MLNIQSKGTKDLDTIRAFIKKGNLEFLKELATKHTLPDSDVIRQLIQAFKERDFTSYSYTMDTDGDYKTFYVKTENFGIIDDIKRVTGFSRAVVINIILELAKIEESKK